MSALRLLPLLTLLACGSGDPPTARGPASEAATTAQGQASAGTFELIITGDVQDRFSGAAHFYTGTAFGEQGTMIIMNENPDAPDGRSLMISTSGGRPGVGEYLFIDVEALGEDEDLDDLPPGLFSAQVYSPGGYMLQPLGGTLRITESTPTRLAGTLAFPALGMRFTSNPPPRTGPVRVEGRFEAQFVDVPAADGP